MIQRVAVVNRNVLVGLILCIVEATTQVQNVEGALIGVDFDNSGGTVPSNWNQFTAFGL
jgi:hypothetical protein